MHRVKNPCERCQCPCMRSTMKQEGAAPPSGSAFAPTGTLAEEEAPHGNNYSRPEGQNVLRAMTSH